MEKPDELITIPSSIDNFFLRYLILKKPIFDSILKEINGNPTALGHVPIRILAKFLYFNYLYRDLNEQEKWDMVYSRRNRMIIMKELDLNEKLFNSHLTKMRRFGILKGRKVNPLFIIYPKEEYILSYKIILNE